MRLLKRLAGGLALMLFGAGLALLVLEAGVRLLHLHPDRFWEPHPVVGTRLTPGKSGWWTQEELEFRVPVEINRHGWRDVDHTLDKPPDTERVLILGDSFIEAMQVPLPAMLGRRLEEKLAAARPAPVEVISMGVSNYGTAAELLAYREFGSRYDPDAVVLAFYPGNDVRNNSPAMEDVVRPIYRDGELERMQGPPPKGGEASWIGWLLGWSDAYHFVRKAVLTRAPALADFLHGLGLIGARGARMAPAEDGIPVEYQVYAADPGPKWSDAWQHTEQILRRLRDHVHADDAELILLVVTARERVYPETWETILETYPAMQDREWRLAAPEQRILNWCEQNGVRAVALTPVFQARREAAASPLHFYHDGHWTEAGHDLAAETLAPAVAEVLDRKSRQARDHRRATE